MANIDSSEISSTSPIVIWCDPTAYEDLNEVTKETLQQAVPDLRIQPDVKECARFFERRYKHRKLILITSGSIGREFVPEIHHHENLVSIIIFCQNKENQIEWTAKHSKVKSIVTEDDELLDCLLTDLELFSN